MTVTLEPPKPVTELQATVIPQLTARATVLGDVLNAFGAHADDIRIAQEGFANGDFNAVTIRGLDHNGYVADEARLLFDEIKRQANITVNLSGGRSMTEAISRQLAQAVMYSVNTMKRKGLSIRFVYWFKPHVNTVQTQARYNLSDAPAAAYAPGHGPRRMFEVTPGLDNGIHYAHYTARRIG